MPVSSRVGRMVGWWAPAGAATPLRCARAGAPARLARAPTDDGRSLQPPGRLRGEFLARAATSGRSRGPTSSSVVLPLAAALPVPCLPAESPVRTDRAAG